MNFIMFSKRSQRKRKREEQQESERKMEREKKMMEQQMMLLQQKQKLLEMQAQCMQEERRGAGGTSVDFKVNDVKETTFESPTEEEIKQLMEKPRPLGEKKES